MLTELKEVEGTVGAILKKYQQDRGQLVSILQDVQAEFKLRQCPGCGSYWAPEKQLAFIAKKANIPLKTFSLCPDCRD